MSTHCDLNQFLGPDFDDRNRFDEFYDELVDRLGGPGWLVRLLPFDAATLRASYAQDKHFNTDLTPIKTWDRVADRLPPSLATHGISWSTPSQRVCLLKKAAEKFCESATATRKETDEC